MVISTVPGRSAARQASTNAAGVRTPAALWKARSDADAKIISSGRLCDSAPHRDVGAAGGFCAAAAAAAIDAAAAERSHSSPEPRPLDRDMFPVTSPIDMDRLLAMFRLCADPVPSQQLPSQLMKAPIVCASIKSQMPAHSFSSCGFTSQTRGIVAFPLCRPVFIARAAESAMRAWWQQSGGHIHIRESKER